MKLEIQLSKQLPNIIGSDITMSGEVVGEITKYDAKTGYTECKLDESAMSELPWNSPAGVNNGMLRYQHYDSSIVDKNKGK